MIARTLPLRILSASLALNLLPCGSRLAAQESYMLPPPEIVQLVDGLRAPQVSVAPDNRTILLQQRPALPAIDEVAQPELRLAGLRINPATNGASRPWYASGLALLDLADGRERTVTGLPDKPVLTELSWSPDSRHVAFLAQAADRLELWLLDVASAQARRLVEGRVNNSYYGAAFTWTPDSAALLVRMVPADRGPPPQRSPVPAAPVIQESSGAARPARTYQDLLQDSHDAELFSHYCSAQLVEVDLAGGARRIGAPALFRQVSLSPDGRYIFVNRSVPPFSYRVPAFRFPQSMEIWDRDGGCVHPFAELPLADRVPITFSATTEGPRAVGWRADAAATLVWVEALDRGDPAVAVPRRDRLYLLPAPFTGEPVTLTELAYRFDDLQWSEDGFALVAEFWRADRHRRTWLIHPDRPGRAAETPLFDYRTEDRYNDPGTPALRRSSRGTEVLHTIDGGRALLMTGSGATPEGNRPFLTAVALASGATTELWRSAPPWYENVVTLLDADGRQLLTMREAVDIQPNYFIRDLAADTLRQLTHFEHPTPQLRDVRKELIRYPRADGVQLSATLYLPPGHDPAVDGPLPVLVWAYPREFRSSDAASQVADSPHRFAGMSYWGPHFALTQGFAVVENATMPVVGEGDAEPNDSFVEQLVMSAQAVIDELARRGVGDPTRCAIGGHSYGAFMAANLLAHSRIFRAGIARSGAFNRTLTPFGFQAEPRNLWQAPATYLAMSPFMHAAGIRDPILFIHGAADDNSGTFPLQSERMYAAVSGLGGAARLVLLPAESHGYRARESVLHMLWEQTEWLNHHVRDAPPHGSAAGQSD
jgi:dipeptidyl aminopeptidase/acylaminoacyl peptidase